MHVHLCKHTEEFCSSYLSSVSTRLLFFSFFFYPCTLLHFVSWDILENAFSQASSAPPSHLITSSRGDKNYQSAVHKVHLRLGSDLVSTFCCTRVDINHSAERSSTCRTLPTSQPRCLSSGSGLISPEQELVIRLMSLLSIFSFRFWGVTVTHPGLLHRIVLYQPPDPYDTNVSLAAFVVNCLKDGAILIFPTSPEPPHKKRDHCSWSFPFWLYSWCVRATYGPFVSEHHLASFESILGTFVAFFFSSPLISFHFKCVQQPYHHSLTSTTIHNDLLMYPVPWGIRNQVN